MSAREVWRYGAGHSGGDGDRYLFHASRGECDQFARKRHVEASRQIYETGLDYTVWETLLASIPEYFKFIN